MAVAPHLVSDVGRAKLLLLLLQRTSTIQDVLNAAFSQLGGTDIVEENLEMRQCRVLGAMRECRLTWAFPR